MTDPHSHADHHHASTTPPAAHGHGSHRKTYMVVFAWLVFLTVVEVVLTYVMGGAALITMLVTAAVIKAGLVAMYFMHLKFERKTLAIVVLAPIVFATILIIGLMPDSARWGL